MLCFDQGNHRFNYRVAGVAIVDGKVLIHRAENEPFWSLPGGRGEFFELSKNTLAREMMEELKVPVDVGRLLWIAENFYDNLTRRYHELAWYYHMTLPDSIGPSERPEPFLGDDNGVPVEFRWHPIDQLHNLIVQPRFLIEGLRKLPQTVQHVIEEG